MSLIMEYLARDILEEFEDKGVFTKIDIIKIYEKDWSMRSIHYAIQALRRRGLIESIPHLGDQRYAKYRIKKEKQEDGMHDMLRDTRNRQLQSSTD